MQFLFRRIRGLRARVGGRSRPSPGGADRGSLTRRRVIAGLGAVAAAWVAFAVYSESAQGRAADSRVQQLQQQNDALRQEIDMRMREIAEAQSDSWLVDEARRLGYVRDGEKVYVPVPGGQKLPADGGIDTGPLPSFAAPAPSGPPPQTPPPPQTGGTPPPPTPVVVPTH